MYIIKNAFRNITRAKGRNLLIGFITLAIAIASFVAITIMASANEAEARGKEQLSITATIDLNRQYLMKQAQEKGTDIREALSGHASLTLDELKSFADSSYIENFNYQLTSSLSKTDSFTAVSNSNSTQQQGVGQQVPGQMMQQSSNTGDFTIVGYSSKEVMTDFISGDKEVTTGSIFAENSQGLECLVSEELNTYNNIGIGSTFTLVNPRDSAQSYTFTVTGIYTSNEYSSRQTGMGFPGSDPANQIYVSFNSLNSIVSASSSTLTGNITGTFSFNSVENFENFQAEVKESDCFQSL